MTMRVIVSLALALTACSTNGAPRHGDAEYGETLLEQSLRRAQRHLDDERALATLRDGPYATEGRKVQSLQLLVSVEGPRGVPVATDYAAFIRGLFGKAGVTASEQPGDATLRIHVSYEPVMESYAPTSGGPSRACRIGDEIDASAEFEWGDVADSFEFAASPVALQQIPWCERETSDAPPMSRALQDYVLDIVWRVAGARALAAAALDLELAESELEWSALELLGPDAVEPILQTLPLSTSEHGVIHAAILLRRVPSWQKLPVAKRQLNALVTACAAHAPKLNSIVADIDEASATKCKTPQ